MITLKQSVVDKIKESPDLRRAIGTALRISHTTVYKYLNNNDPALANVNVLIALNKDFLIDNDLLENS